MDLDDDCMSDDDCDYDGDYYRDMEDDVPCEEISEKKLTADAERADAQCLDASQVERLFTDSIDVLAESCGLNPSFAKALLIAHHWDVEKIKSLLSSPESSEAAMVTAGLMPKPPPNSDACSSSSRPSSSGGRKSQSRPGSKNSVSSHTSRVHPSSSSINSSATDCAVCCRSDVDMRALACGHSFCLSCWRSHIEARLSEGVSSKTECMYSGCSLICPPELAISFLDKPALRAKYEKFVFRDYVESHPLLRFCVGRDCTMIILCRERQPKRVECTKCESSFCALCGDVYHAPTTCDTVKKWLVKCADDSETANYISAHTKDCPQCHACIEKNGGCNHMHCSKCKHHFCWMCFGDWKTHGSEYYECSRYKENPEVAAEAKHMKARRALEKYLHYFERFENHSKSLKMEEDLRDRLRRKIDEKVLGHDGTWIDWQYLHDAASLLTRCRYTLQYTYPFAYYQEPCPRKELFEYQQAQLEKEVEDLAWAVERADSEARGNLQAHMHRAEHRRMTLLHDFFLNDDGLPSSSAAVGCHS